MNGRILSNCCGRSLAMILGFALYLGVIGEIDIDSDKLGALTLAEKNLFEKGLCTLTSPSGGIGDDRKEWYLEMD